jgi:Wiskott-Aldrich syndrome protein
MYRRAREERKAAEAKLSKTDPEDVPNKITEDGASSTPVPAPISHIVSNARGPYPELEMIPVPNSHRRNISATSGDNEANFVRRITQRLSDMGFTANVYPSLPRKINDQMADIKPRTKDQEDDIVTTLLEELLTFSPKPTPVPGSGNRKDLDLPGSWY